MRAHSLKVYINDKDLDSFENGRVVFANRPVFPYRTTSQYNEYIHAQPVSIQHAIHFDAVAKSDAKLLVMEFRSWLYSEISKNPVLKITFGHDEQWIYYAEMSNITVGHYTHEYMISSGTLELIYQPYKYSKDTTSITFQNVTSIKQTDDSTVRPWVRSYIDKYPKIPIDLLRIMNKYPFDPTEYFDIRFLSDRSIVIGEYISEYYSMNGFDTELEDEFLGTLENEGKFTLENEGKFTLDDIVKFALDKSLKINMLNSMFIINNRFEQSLSSYGMFEDTWITIPLGYINKILGTELSIRDNYNPPRWGGKKQPVDILNESYTHRINELVHNQEGSSRPQIDIGTLLPPKKNTPPTIKYNPVTGTKVVKIMGREVVDIPNEIEDIPQVLDLVSITWSSNAVNGFVTDEHNRVLFHERLDSRVSTPYTRGRLYSEANVMATDVVGTLSDNVMSIPTVIFRRGMKLQGPWAQINITFRERTWV